jgi:solute carrier family 25 carnitine/acylcarnitine transporter 20/29
MDSVLLGSMHAYRRFFAKIKGVKESQLSLLLLATAGMMGGWTVSVVATPVEHIKARLQVQYHAKATGKRLYSGPIDCIHTIYKQNGIPGLYRGFFATLLQRSNFFVFWASASGTSRYLKSHTELSPAAISFASGGAGAQAFWMTAYPFDVVKQRIMTDGFGMQRKYPTWWSCVQSVFKEAGLKGFWRGKAYAFKQRPFVSETS